MCSTNRGEWICGSFCRRSKKSSSGEGKKMNARAKKRVGLLVVAIAVAAGAGLGAYVVREHLRANRVDAAREEGLAAYAEEDWVRAVDRLGYCVGRGLPDAEVYTAFADARQRVPNDDGSQYRQAILAAQMAINIEPENIKTLTLLTELYINTGFFSELFDTIDTILQIDPSNRSALELAVFAHRAQDDLEESLEAAQRLAAAYPDDYSAQGIRIEMMRANKRPAAEIDARLAEITLAFPDVLSTALLRAAIHLDRGERDEAEQVVREAISFPITEWVDLERLVSVVDELSVEERDLAGRADGVLQDYLEDPKLGIHAARLTLARGFRWGRLADMDRCFEVIANGAADATDASLGWASLTSIITERTPDDRVENELRSRETEDSKWWGLVTQIAQSINRKDIQESRTLLAQITPMTRARAVNDMALVRYFEALVDLESGEWRTASSNLSGIGQAFGWRIARQTLSRVMMEHGFPADAYAVLQRFPGSDNLLLAESLVMLGETVTVNADLSSDLATLAGELETMGAEEPRMLILAARAYTSIGRLDDASRIASMAVQVDGGLSIEQLVPLAAQMAKVNPTAAQAVLEQVSVESAAAYSYLWSPASSIGPTADALAASLLAQIDGADGDERLALKRQLIDVYVRQNRPDEAVAVMRQISEENESNALVQLQILGADAAWSDEELIESAIGRLRTSTGEDATRWRIFALRQAIVFGQDANAVLSATIALANAIRGQRDDPQAMMMLANALEFQGDIQGAATYLSRAVVADPRQHGYLVKLIEMLMRSADMVEADNRLADLASIPDVADEIRRARASLLGMRGQEQEAIADLEYLRPQKNHADLKNLAVLFVRQGDLDQAEAAFEEMLECDGVLDDEIAIMADFFAIRYGDTPEGIARGEAVLSRLKDRESADIAVLKAAFYERHRRLEDAERFYTEAVQADPGRASPALAMFLLRQARLQEAKAVCDQNAMKSPVSEEDRLRNETLNSLGRIASICEELGSEADEVDAILGALNDTNSTTTLVQFADALEELSRTRSTDRPDYDRFVGQLESITASDPGFFAAWRLRVWAETERAQRDAADSSAALAVARLAARTVRNDARTAGLVVGVLMQSQDWDEAMFAAQEWRNRSLADPFEADFAIAAIHIIRKELAEAFRVVEPWWRDGDGDARITDARLVVVASALLGVGRIDDAHNLLWQPDSTETAWAIQYLQLAELMGDRPEDVRAWIGRAQTFLKAREAGQLEIANAWYNVAAQTGDDSDWERVIEVLNWKKIEGAAAPTASLMLASAHDNLGQTEEAERAYRAGLDLMPEQNVPLVSFTLNNLAYLVSQQEGRAEEAIELGERSLRIAIENGVPLTERAVFLDTLGICYYQAGRFEEARDMFSAAIEADVSKGGAYVGLAESFLKLGQTEQAAAQITAIDSTRALSTALSEKERGRLAAVRASLSGSNGPG
jgi:tetratricopeptide (TPR) repeat protein